MTPNGQPECQKGTSINIRLSTNVGLLETKADRSCRPLQVFFPWGRVAICMACCFPLLSRFVPSRFAPPQACTAIVQVLTTPLNLLFKGLNLMQDVTVCYKTRLIWSQLACQVDS